MQTSFRTNALDRNDFPASQETYRDKATIDAAVTSKSLGITIHDGDRASAAIAFSAAFFGTRQPGLTQIFQERGVRRDVLEPNYTAIQRELDCAGHDKQL
jgi:hypothetical protein